MHKINVVLITFHTRSSHRIHVGITDGKKSRITDGGVL